MQTIQLMLHRIHKTNVPIVFPAIFPSLFESAMLHNARLNDDKTSGTIETVASQTIISS